MCASNYLNLIPIILPAVYLGRRYRCVLTMVGILILFLWDVVYGILPFYDLTPPKTNIEPENTPSTNHQFLGSMLVFGGVMYKLRTVMDNLYHFRWRRVVNQLPAAFGPQPEAGIVWATKGGRVEVSPGSSSVFHCFEAGAQPKKQQGIFSQVGGGCLRMSNINGRPLMMFVFKCI